MIRAKDAIATARGLIGTPYSELDCINLIKAVIRRSPGGVKNYTTAGTDTLWHSGTLSGKYRDLTFRQIGLQNAKAGMLAFKGKPTDTKGDGQPQHVGLVTERGTVIHSSSVKRQVVETKLTAKDNWTLLAVHKYISIAEDEPMAEGDRVFYRARVATEHGRLNVRAGPSTGDEMIFQLEKGTVVDVMFVYPNGWCYIDEDGDQGYVLGKYLEKIEAEPEPEPLPVNPGYTTLINQDGMTLTLLGDWRVVEGND